MRFHNFISVILHPIVIPTIGVMLYYLLIPNSISSNQRLSLLGLIFITTYLIPLVLLILLKKLKLIASFKSETIKERKLPVAIMIILFYLLGNTLHNTLLFFDFGILFYATTLGLLIIYLLFFLKFKTSIHLLSIGVATGFFLVMSKIYTYNYTSILIIFLAISGILGTSRLHLKAHTPKEVYIGFILGLIAPSIVYYFL